MHELMEKLSLRFNDEKVFELALTHSSFNSQKGNMDNNEKLEFVGDAVLQLIITEELFRRLPDKPEGELTRIRANVVCERSLSIIARSWDLGKYIKMSNGEEQTGGRERASLLADAVEAIIASVYIDSGYKEAREFVLKNFEDTLNQGTKDELFLDHKTKLQELLQENGEVNIHYEMYKSLGPAHKRKFYTKVLIDEITMGKGEGMTKKESEQDAARDALSKLVTKEIN